MGVLEQIEIKIFWAGFLAFSKLLASYLFSQFHWKAPHFLAYYYVRKTSQLHFCWTPHYLSHMQVRNYGPHAVDDPFVAASVVQNYYLRFDFDAGAWMDDMFPYFEQFGHYLLMKGWSLVLSVIADVVVIAAVFVDLVVVTVAVVPVGVFAIVGFGLK